MTVRDRAALLIASELMCRQATRINSPELAAAVELKANQIQRRQSAALPSWNRGEQTFGRPLSPVGFEPQPVPSRATDNCYCVLSSKGSRLAAELRVASTQQQRRAAGVAPSVFVRTPAPGDSKAGLEKLLRDGTELLAAGNADAVLDMLEMLGTNSHPQKRLRPSLGRLLVLRARARMAKDAGSQHAAKAACGPLVSARASLGCRCRCRLPTANSPIVWHCGSGYLESTAARTMAAGSLSLERHCNAASQ